MRLINWPSLRELRRLLLETAPTPEEFAARLQTVERDIILPVKAVALGIMSYSLYHTRWFQDMMSARWVAHQMVERFFLIYLSLTVIVAALLLLWKHLPIRLSQWVIFISSFVDGLFLTTLLYVTGGFDSTLYWLFLGLIVRNALSLPLATPQLLLNFLLSACYLTGGILDLVIPDEPSDFEQLSQASWMHPAEPFLLRLIVLWLLTVCCYGIQVLFEKQRQALEEAREFVTRQKQLSSAGRLAAKIAHQMKNPLGIINNAAYSLQRELRGESPQLVQVQIIREEVERADKIITNLMGYAQLAEGQVEKLNVTEALDRAVQEVFPPAAQYPIIIRRDYSPHLPPLLMQRIHLSEILVNVLQNAREAMPAGGELRLAAHPGPNNSVVVSIGDSGPGIPPERLEKVFDPYFSTKRKGTGLGLAIVKHNLELYGGTVRGQSELGKGAQFILQFPTRTFMKRQA